MSQGSIQYGAPHEFSCVLNYQVSLSPGVGRGGGGTSTRGRAAVPPPAFADLKKKPSLESSAEYDGAGGEEDGDDDDEEEEEEEIIKPFDAKRAHETFIWRALQGVMTVCKQQ